MLYTFLYPTNDSMCNYCSIFVLCITEFFYVLHILEDFKINLCLKIVSRYFHSTDYSVLKNWYFVNKEQSRSLIVTLAFMPEMSF